MCLHFAIYFSRLWLAAQQPPPPPHAFAQAAAASIIPDDDDGHLAYKLGDVIDNNHERCERKEREIVSNFPAQSNFYL